MKKLTTIAVAAALVAPMTAMAETTLYGLVDANLYNQDNGTTDAWDVRDGNGSSRLGVKGSEDLGNGLKAVFQYEWSTGQDLGTNNATATSSTYNSGSNGANAGLSTRVAMVGLSGGFGTVSIGRQWSPAYAASGITNTFNMDGGVWGNTTVFGRTRVGNSVAYNSPNFGGFTAGAIAVMSNDTDTSANLVAEDGVDNFGIGLGYANGPFAVKASWEETNNSTGNDVESWAIGGSFKSDMFAVQAGYQDNETAAGGDQDSFQITGQVFFGNNTLLAGYGERDTGVAATEREAWQIGLQHSFSKRTRAYVEYSELEVGSADTETFGIGLRHDF